MILTRRFAIKIPSVRSWRDFLFGLLNNMNEARTAREGLDGFCPVVLAIPGGFALVMPRVEILCERDFAAFDPAAFCRRDGYEINAEHKPDSFGRLNGTIVAVDYGW